MKIRFNTLWEIYNMNQILIYYSNAEKLRLQKLRLQKLRFNKIKNLDKLNKENFLKKYINDR